VEAEDAAVLVDSRDQVAVLAHLSHLVALNGLLLVQQDHLQVVLGTHPQDEEIAASALGVSS
jgi:hypothetical protein